MKKLFITFVTLTTAMATTLAYAEHAEQSLDKSPDDFSIAHFDSNHDGNISLQEYLAGDPSNTERVYRHLDANSDGVLDQQEQTEVEAVYQLMHQQTQTKANSI